MKKIMVQPSNKDFILDVPYSLVSKLTPNRYKCHELVSPAHSTIFVSKPNEFVDLKLEKKGLHEKDYD